MKSWHGYLPRRLAVFVLALVAVTAWIGSGTVQGDDFELLQPSASQGYWHTCALAKSYEPGVPDNAVQCWGINEYGQLGDGSTTDRATPRFVITDSSDDILGNIASVAPGWTHTCAVTKDTGGAPGGGVYCWGGNEHGELGYPTSTDCEEDGDPVECSLVAKVVPGLSDGVAAVSTSIDSQEQAHTCALMATTGGVKCWGFNGYGQLGNNTTNDSMTPVNVCATSGCSSSLTGVETLHVATGYTCGLMASSGAVKCWGLNAAGSLGVPTSSGTTCSGFPCSKTPVNVCRDFSGGSCQTIFTGAQTLSVGGGFGCALMGNQTAECWGFNNSIIRTLGDGTPNSRYYPAPVCESGSGPSCNVLDNVLSVRTGSTAYHACAVISGGTLKCWGFNNDGQIGNGTIGVSYYLPTNVSVGAVDDVYVGGLHTCAYTTSDVLKCWGDNAFGQAGDDTSGNDRTTPVGVALDSDGDSCPDEIEVSLPVSFDPKNRWDFYDVNGDRVIDLPNDILGVINHSSPGGYSDPSYEVYDRGPGYTAPDGVIDLPNDILGVILKFLPGGCF